MKPPTRPNHCLPIPRLERINYFYGQLLGVREFRAEQSYFRDKLKLHNRYLHGHGVVCGLEVTDCRRRPDPCEPEPCPPGEKPRPETPEQTPKQQTPKQDTPKQDTPKQDTPKQDTPKQDTPEQDTPEQDTPDGPCAEHDAACLQIECGLALDCCGNEVIVRGPISIDPLRHLDRKLRKQLEERKPVTVWISVCFHERGVEPVRPLTVDECGSLLPDCVHARYRDDVCVRITTEEPCDRNECSPCDGCCDDPCVPLARVVLQRDGRGVTAEIDNSQRRPLSMAPTTRITGINWVHGGEYTSVQARELLNHGLVVRFSAPIHASTAARGVFDTWAIEGGGGRRTQIYLVDGELKAGPRETGDLWRSVLYQQQTTNDALNDGDRVLITMRTAFLLDHCCRPVDGEHIGGRVPLLDEFRTSWGNDKQERCPPPCAPPEPDRLLPWHSGNGSSAGTFESWIYIIDERAAATRRKP